jgi:hypothetical protein
MHEQHIVFPNSSFGSLSSVTFSLLLQQLESDLRIYFAQGAGKATQVQHILD